MKQSVKKLLSIILSITMLLSITAGIDLSAYAMSSSGKCGDKVTYTFDSSTGKLTISGTGEMYNYDSYLINNRSPFYKQNSIKSIVIKSGVTSIGNCAFEGCMNLISASIPNGIVSVGNSAFYRCESLSNLTLPNSITKIKDYAFDVCSSLKSVVLPANLEEIGDYAFYCCSFTEINIPSKVKKIENGAIKSENLERITVNSDNKYYSAKDGILYSKDFLKLIIYPVKKNGVSFTIPNGVKEIDQRAFYDCENIKTVFLSNTVEKIGEYAFYGSSIENIDLAMVKLIYNNAFDDCENMKNIFLPSTVEQVGYGAVDWQKVELPKDTNINMIGDYKSKGYDSSYYAKSYDVCYEGPYLMYVSREQSGKFVVKEGTIGIAAWAFEGCEDITEIQLPKSLKYVSYAAFSNCPNLKSITFPENVEKIYSAFNGCNGIKKITVLNPLCDVECRSIDGEYAGFTYGVDNPVFCGYTNSTLFNYIKYLNDNYSDNYSFESLGTYDCEHNYSINTEKATKTENGSINKKCSICKKRINTTIYKPTTYSISTSTYTYDGKVKSPSITVKDSKGNTLKKDTDYTVSSPSGRKNVGTYTYKITFKGNYSGTATKSFKINPPKTSLSKLTATSKGFKATWSKKSTQVTGYQIQYSTSSKFTSPKTVTVSSYKTTSKTISKLTAKKKYYVRIRTYKTVSGTKYYSAWSSAKSITTKK